MIDWDRPEQLSNGILDAQSACAAPLIQDKTIEGDHTPTGLRRMRRLYPTNIGYAKAGGMEDTAVFNMDDPKEEWDALRKIIEEID